jgi:hypothetical protein
VVVGIAFKDRNIGSEIDSLFEFSNGAYHYIKIRQNNIKEKAVC